MEPGIITPMWPGPGLLRRRTLMAMISICATVLLLCFMIMELIQDNTDLLRLQLKMAVVDSLHNMEAPAPPPPAASASCKLKPLKSRQQFWDYLNLVEYQCNNMKDFGVGDGSKAVCMDHPLFTIEPYNCHVLSFGINDDWSFDDDFDKYGCRVFSFDPTINLADHKRSSRIKFFNLGISNFKGTRVIGEQQCEVDRYENILKRLHLLDTKIDYLKIDVEGAELDFLQDVFRNSPSLLQNVAQIGMEIHHYDFDDVAALAPTSLFVLYWQYFEELRCQGFKMVTMRRNNIASEMLWVRVPVIKRE